MPRCDDSRGLIIGQRPLPELLASPQHEARLGGGSSTEEHPKNKNSIGARQGPIPGEALRYGGNQQGRRIVSPSGSAQGPFRVAPPGAAVIPVFLFYFFFVTSRAGQGKA